MLKESLIVNTLSCFISFSVFEKNVKIYFQDVLRVPLTKASKRIAQNRLG